MAGHPDKCPCFECLIEAAAAAHIAAGQLDPWDYPLVLAQILARIVGDHPSADERHRRASFFINLLTAATDMPVSSESPNKTAEIVPFRQRPG